MEICEGCFDKLDQHAVETEDGHLLCPNCYDDYLQDMAYKHGEAKNEIGGTGGNNPQTTQRD